MQVTATGNQDFEDFLIKNQNNSFISQSPEDNLIAEIMLGCLNENQAIYYSNDSDEFGMDSRTYTGEPAKALLSGLNEDKKIILGLTKLPLSGGRGAPACYSHFYNIELINSLN
jgi:hypothetical protein